MPSQDTYKKTNPLGVHVTGRRCPRCAAALDEVTPPQALDGECEGLGWLYDSTVDFGEVPMGDQWGPKPVHNLGATMEHMKRADLVVVWGSSMGVLANYFDPWCPSSQWAKPGPRGHRVKGAGPCKLAIVTKGEVQDQEFAALKIEDDVDEVMRSLLECLGLDPAPEYDPSCDPILLNATAPFEGENICPWTIRTEMPPLS